MIRVFALRPVSRPGFGFRAAKPMGIEATRPARLVFTERLLIGTMLIAYLLAASVPVFGFQLSNSFLKHVPLIFLCGASLVHFTGLALNRHQKRVGSTFEATWPFILLGLFAIVGSSVARWALEVDDTFMTLGVYLLIVPVLAVYPIERPDMSHWTRALGTMWIAVSFMTVAGAGLHYSVGEIFHEVEFITLSGLVMLYYRANNNATRSFAILLILAVAIYNHKLTGYIVGAAAVIYALVDTGWRRTEVQWRTMYKLGALLAVSVFVVALLVVYFAFQEYLPTGNTNVRLKQYDQAISQFIASPIWGDAYTGGSGEAFVQGMRSLNIPTHSDILDMLKHGGLIAFGLFVVGFLKVLWLLTRAAAVVEDRVSRAFFLSMRFFVVAAAATFAINPILLKGPYVIVIWGNTGLAIGLALAALRRRGKVVA